MKEGKKMLDKTQIMQMIDEVKGSLSKLESALGEGEEETPMEEGSEMKNEKMDGDMPKESSVEGEEEMPPMLKKFVRG